MLNPGRLEIWALLAAAVAGAIAIAAMVVGSRRKAKEQYHPLKGSLDRRMKMFGGMADGCYENRELCGAQNEVPPDNSFSSDVEMKKGEYKEMV